jgi:hypothetical protein
MQAWIINPGAFVALALQLPSFSAKAGNPKALAVKEMRPMEHNPWAFLLHSFFFPYS